TSLPPRPHPPRWAPNPRAPAYTTPTAHRGTASPHTASPPHNPTTRCPGNHDPAHTRRRTDQSPASAQATPTTTPAPQVAYASLLLLLILVHQAKPPTTTRVTLIQRSQILRLRRIHLAGQQIPATRRSFTTPHDTAPGNP